MNLRFFIVCFTVFCAVLQPGSGQSAAATEIKTAFNGKEIKFTVYNLTVKGMKGKELIFGFQLSREGEWLTDTWVGLDPQMVKYDPAVWKGEAFWFSYTYDEIQKAGNPGQSCWGSFFVQEAATNKVLLQKDLEFRIPDSNAQAYALAFRDDFSKNNLDDLDHYVRFGPSLFTVKGGVLRVEVNATQWHQMELLNILPCFGKNSQLALKVRWAGGDGASLLIGSDWRYRHSGRKTHFYIDFNQNQVIGWNTDGTLVQDVSFKKGEWVSIRIERKANTMQLYVNNALKLTKMLDALSATENTAEEAGYGGYFLETDVRPYLQVIELDDLQVEGEPAPVTFSALAGNFALDKAVDPNPYRFTVIFEKGLEQWAEGQIAASIPYIREAAQLYGVPPMSRSLGMVSARGKYYSGGAGYNNRGVVYQEGNNSNANAVSSHELAHNWYAYYGKKWITESSADFCWFAYLEAVNKRLMTAGDFLFNIDQYPGGAYLAGADGFYLDDEEKAADFFAGGMPQWDVINTTAWKQRVFFYVLYRTLGETGFRKLHSMAAGLDHGMTSQELQSFAEKIKGQELSGLFKGWVFPGKTVYPVQTVFQDTDNDGLTDLDELLWGTNASRFDTDQDAYSDYSEIAAGYNPLSAKSPGQQCILVDGAGADWGTALPVINDAEDSGGSEDIDTAQLLADSQNRLVYALVTFRGNLPTPPDAASWNYYLTFDFDVDDDALFDYRINLFYNKKSVSNAFRTKGLVGNNWNPEKWTAMDSSQVNYSYREGVLEAAIPLDLAGNARSLKVYINSGSPAGTDYLDKAPVTVPFTGEFPQHPQVVWKIR